MFLHSKFIALLVAGAAPEAGFAREEPTPPTVEYVLKILDSDAEELWRLKYKLVELGTGAFPVYESLLTNPKTTTYQAARLLQVVREVRGDRSRFLESAMKGLTSHTPALRYSSVRLLGVIGGKESIPLVVALLYDEDLNVLHGAAEALSDVGGRREMIVFDALIRAAEKRGNEKRLVAILKKYREALEFRLKLEERNKAIEKNGQAAPPPPGMP